MFRSHLRATIASEGMLQARQSRSLYFARLQSGHPFTHLPMDFVLEVLVLPVLSEMRSSQTCFC